MLPKNKPERWHIKAKQQQNALLSTEILAFSQGYGLPKLKTMSAF